MGQMDVYGWDASMDISLREKLRSDLKNAMRNKDSGAKDAIRIIMSEFFKLTVPLTLESGKKSTRSKKDEEITDDDIQGIATSLAKSEKILLEAKGEASSRYLELLQSYLPQVVAREEIEAWIKDNIDLSQFKNAMQAMGPIMKHFGKRADGGDVKDILQQIGAAG